MDAGRFDALLLSLSLGASRRGLLAALAGVSVGLPLAIVDDSAAKKKRKKRQSKKHAVTRQDATCDAGIGDGFTMPFPNGRLAQTFAPLASGKLVSAQPALNKEAGTAGDYILQLSPVDAFGAPTDTVLASVVLQDDDVASGISTVPFAFASPASVTASTFDALVLSQPGTVSFRWLGELFATCQGRSFSSEEQTGEFTQISNDWGFTVTLFVSS